MEVWWETTKFLSQDSRSQGWDLKLGPSKHDRTCYIYLTEIFSELVLRCSDIKETTHLSWNT
jgi:hypothetical protein